MGEKAKQQPQGSIQTSDDPNDQAPRKPYEKPCLEPHEISIAILGNATPVTADGLSGSFRH